MIIRKATSSDLKYIESLRRKESDALGFVPKARYESIVTGQRPRLRDAYPDKASLLVIEENADRVGFAYTTFSEMAKVHQIAIQEDARRCERARALLTQIESNAMAWGCIGIRARVASDLESNLFWNAEGYEKVGEGKGTMHGKGDAKSGRILNVYTKVFLPLFGQSESESNMS